MSKAWQDRTSYNNLSKKNKITGYNTSIKTINTNFQYINNI